MLTNIWLEQANGQSLETFKQQFLAEGEQLFDTNKHLYVSACINP
jgi:hypothetical protein